LKQTHQQYLKGARNWAALVGVALVCCGCTQVPKSSGRQLNRYETNLRNLGIMLHVAEGDGDKYCATFTESAAQFPDKYKASEVKPEYFVCPGTGHRPGSLNAIEEWSDYIYIGNLQDGVMHAALVIDPPENHHNKYGYVLWGDGSVTRESSEQTRRLIADPFCMDNFDNASVINYAKPKIKIQIPERLKRYYGPR
jgi:hypothetical protein